jgi:hypothetical protein
MTNQEMRSHRIRRFMKFAVIAIPAALLFVALGGYVVMSLWNWLMPAIFAWRTITFWQAVGILILSKILFGSFRGGSGRGYGRNRYWRRRIIERWEQMTPEERERFRQGFGARCGPAYPPPPSTPNAGSTT